MSNVFKKFLKKRKRAKIQAQNQKAARTAGRNGDDYQQQLSRHRHAVIRKTVITASVVIAAAAALLIFIEKRSYRSYKTIQIHEQEDVVSNQYEMMSGKILRYSPEGASLVNNEMSAYWSSLYEMQNPVADINDDWAVIADVDGTELRIFNKEGEAGSVTTSYSIVKARISANGLVAAILDGGDSTWINYYASDGSLIAENQTHVEDPGYPMDIAVPDDGEIMMVAYQFIDGSDTTSYVAFYNFGDVGQNEPDRIVSGYTYEGVVIPEIEYLDADSSLALREDGFTLYKGRQIPKEAVTEKVDKEIVSTFSDDETIGMVFKNGDKDKKYTMKVYSPEGNLRFEKNFNIPYTTIKMSGGNILLYNDSQICVMNSRGTTKYTGTVDGSINNFIKIGWNRYLLVMDSGVRVIKLS